MAEFVLGIWLRPSIKIDTRGLYQEGSSVIRDE